MIAPPFRNVPASDLFKVIDATTPGAGTLRVKIQTTDLDGEPVSKAVRVELGSRGDARARLAAPGITVTGAGAEPTIASVRPGSEAARLKLRPGDRVQSVSVPNDERKSPFLFALPALAALLAIAVLQRRRRTVWLATG